MRLIAILATVVTIVFCLTSSFVRGINSHEELAYECGYMAGMQADRFYTMPEESFCVRFHAAAKARGWKP